MSWRSELVGRSEFLHDVSSALQPGAGSPVFVSLQGPGGIGKTSLLRALERELRTRAEHVVFLDLMRPTLRRPLSLELATLQAFDLENSSRLESYRLSISALSGSATARGPDSPVASLLVAGAEEFSGAMQGISEEKYVLLDTVDMPMSTSLTVRRFLGASLSGLDRVTVILGGRDAHSVADENTRHFIVAKFDVPPLDQYSAAVFFDGLGFSETTHRGMTTLTQGRPVLLGLAAEWLESGTPLPELLGAADANIPGDSMPTVAAEAFESSLVMRLLELRDNMDLTVLEMARCPFRYGPSIAAHLHATDDDEERHHLARMARLFYVKTTSSGSGDESFALHDEMRDLVNRHVWPAIDPLGKERRTLDDRLVAWYDEQIRGMEEIGTGSDRPSRRVAEFTDVSLYRAEREFFRLRGNLIDHAPVHLITLCSALAAGDIEFVGLSIELCRQLHSSLSELDQVGLARVESDWLRIIGRREAAGWPLKRALAVQALPRALRIELLLSLATIFRENGDAPAAGAPLSEARAQDRGESRQTSAAIDLSEGERFLALGMVAQAVERFTAVMQQCPGREDQDLRAKAADRAAFSQSILGDRQDAIALANEAISTWNEAGRFDEVAFSLCTLASIYRDASSFKAAIENYDLALNYALSQGNQFLEAAALMERGLCHLLIYEEIRYAHESPPTEEGVRAERELATSEQDLRASVNVCYTHNREYLPKAIHELGHTLWERGQIEEARETWEESLNVSLRAGNLRYVLENLIGMCELDIDTADYKRALTWREKVLPYHARTAESHALLWSRLRKLEAEAELAQGMYQLALDGYSTAIPELARHGGWGRYKLEFELAALAAKIGCLPSSERSRWITQLEARWPASYRELSEGRAKLLSDALTRIKKESAP